MMYLFYTSKRVLNRKKLQFYEQMGLLMDEITIIETLKENNCQIKHYQSELSHLTKQIGLG